MIQDQRIAWSVVFVSAATVATATGQAAESPCPIAPVPKVYRDLGRTWALAAGGQGAIVVGRQASDPERYAAGRFQGLIQRRWRRSIPILSEDKVPAAATQIVLLGQRPTSERLDRLCRERGVDLSEALPVSDGFVIECVEDRGRQVVIVGGSNARGVIYGQDALFDLLRREGGPSRPSAGLGPRLAEHRTETGSELFYLVHLSRIVLTRLPSLRRATPCFPWIRRRKSISDNSFAKVACGRSRRSKC